MYHKKLSYLVLALFMISTVGPLASTLFIQNKVPSLATLANPVTAAGATSSESPTDSFDTNPLSGRWNVSQNTGNTNTISNGNLVVSGAANTSSTTPAYYMQRATTKTDSNMQYRYSSQVSGNTSEYFRDVLGEPMTDFTTTTKGWTVNNAYSTISQTNGMLKVVSTGSFSGALYTTPNYLSKNVYTNISFDIYCSISQTFQVYVQYDGNTLGSYYYTFTCPTTQTLFNIPFSSFVVYNSLESISFNRIIIEPSVGSSVTFYLNNIQLLGSQNYATQNLYPNNWGFDSSLEYSYDSLGNITNFQDGTTENITANSFTADYHNTTANINFSVGSSYSSSINLGSSLGMVTNWTKEGTLTFSFNAYSTSGSSSLAFLYSLDGGTTRYIISIIDPIATSSTFYSFTDPVTRSTTNNDLTYYFQITPVSTPIYFSNISYIQANYYNPNFSNTPPTNLNSEYLNMQYLNVINTTFSRTSLSIDSSIYKYFATEIIANQTISNVTIETLSNQTVCTDITTHTSNTWFLESCTAGASWTGTETGYRLFLSFGSSYVNVNVSLNMFYIYDSALGNTENLNPTNAYSYVDPQGYLVNHVTSTSGAYTSISSLSIDTSIYRYLTISIKSDSSTNRYFGLYGAGHYIISAQLLSTSFQTFTFDLSSSSYWTGTFTSLLLAFGNSTGLGTEIKDSVFSIDYILLTAAPQQQQPFQAGFTSSVTNQVVLNVTTQYFNATYFRWDIYLYDQYGNVAAYYYSANQTVTNDLVYYRGKITFNIELSSLSIQMTSDGGSQLFQTNYPDSFTILSQTNTFFTLTNAPNVFIKFSTPYPDWSQSELDYVDAPFTNNIFTNTANSGNWKSVSPTSSLLEAPTTGGIGSKYYYNLSYSNNIEKLDSMSAIMFQGFANLSEPYYASSRPPTYFSSLFYLDEIDASTGTTHHVFLINETTYASSTTAGFISQTWSIYDYLTSTLTNNTYTSPSSTATWSQYNPSLAFSLITSNNRGYITLQTRGASNSTDTSSSNYFDNSFSFNVSKYYPSFAQEYKIYYVNSVTYAYYNAYQDYNALIFQLQSFSFVQRDVFKNPLSFLGGTAGNLVGGFFSSLLASIIALIMTIFLPLILWIGSLITTEGQAVINGIVEPIVAQLQPILSALGPLTNLPAILSALGPLASLATDITGPIDSAISALAGDIWSYMTDHFTLTLNPIIDQLVYYMGTIIGTINTDVLQPLAALLFAGVDWFWNNVVLPILNLIGLLWNTFTGYIWQVVNSMWLWLLGIVNLTALYNEQVLIFNWLLGLTTIGIFYVTWTLIVITISFPFFMSLTDKNILVHIKEVWGMDATFGLSLLGFKIHIPLVIVTLSLVLINPTFVNALFPFLPW